MARSIQSLLMSGAMLLAVAPAPALAQAEAAPDESLAGVWVFQSAPFFGFGVTQEISGEMELIAAGDGTYTCTLSVSDRIPEEDVTIQTEQTCVAVREGDTLHIESTVISVEPNSYNYVPDNFTLTIEASCRMSGVMHAAGDDAVDSEFRCGGALVS